MLRSREEECLAYFKEGGSVPELHVPIYHSSTRFMSGTQSGACNWEDVDFDLPTAPSVASFATSSKARSPVRSVCLARLDGNDSE